MDLEKHKRIFNRISPIYNLFYRGQIHIYSDLLHRYGKEIPISENATVLDLGCGTGAFGATFALCGHDVTGVDLAENMVKRAAARGLKCAQADFLKGLPYPDDSFDLVVCALVAHGLDRVKRRILMREATRLSRGPVLFHDYSSRRHIFINLIEYFEDGDYFNFIKTGLDEMKQFFSEVKVIPVKPYNNWYLCQK